MPGSKLRSTSGASVGFFLLLTVHSLLFGCDQTPSASTSPQRGEPDATYTVRARVEMIPQPGKATSEFIIHHEPIREFKNPDGSLGMNAMMMPVPLAKAATLDGIEVGDIVEVTLAVWTTPGQRGFEARSVTELPAGTTLDLGSP